MHAVIAFPTNAPGGNAAMISDHFGHADTFTIAALEGGEAAVEVMGNTGHANGGCGAVVKVLADRGVRIVVARGMGPGPLRLFAQAGIMVLHAGTTGTVDDALSALKTGQLARFGDEHSCNHHDHDHDHDHHHHH